MFVDSIKVCNGIFVLFAIFLRGLTQLFIALGFNYENEIARLDKEVWVKFSALWVLPLFSGVINLVKTCRSGFNPCLVVWQIRRVEQCFDKPLFRVGVGNGCI